MGFEFVSDRVICFFFEGDGWLAKPDQTMISRQILNWAFNFLYFCMISVQLLCDKVQGEGGMGQNMILYYTGGGGGLERGQIVLHNS